MEKKLILSNDKTSINGVSIMYPAAAQISEDGTVTQADWDGDLTFYIDSELSEFTVQADRVCHSTVHWDYSMFPIRVSRRDETMYTELL